MWDAFALGGGPCHFLIGAPQGRCFKHRLGQQPLKLRILILELLQSLSLADLYPSVFAFQLYSVASETPCLRVQSALAQAGRQLAVRPRDKLRP
jgi:hypothetical protein